MAVRKLEGEGADMDERKPETIEEFRRSLNYGSRTDLLFKVLGGNNLSDEEAAEFLRGLLEKLGEAFDSGDYVPVEEYCFHWQVYGYTPKEGSTPAFQYETTPWAELGKPLSDSRVALISTGGLFMEGDDPLGPNGPTQEEAILQIQEFLRSAPKLSTIPTDFAPENLRVRHPGYDIRGTLKDHNVVFPIDHLIDLAREGFIGEVAENNYSFVGATSQKRLLAEFAPKLADQLLSEGVDATLLVAA